MAFTHAPAYHRYSPWAIAERHDDAQWDHDVQSDRRFSTYSGFADSLLQPMARYLQEPDRTLFISGNPEDDLMHPFPGVPFGAANYFDSDGMSYSLPQRILSPSSSGLSSSHYGSGWSDRERTPWSSPEASTDAHSPDAMYVDHAYYSGHGHNDAKRNHLGHCVALHDVQQYADAQPEKVAFDDEHPGNGSYAQEGYQPMQPNQEAAQHATPIVPSQRDAVDEVSNENHGDEEAPTLRRRRAPSVRTVTSPHLPSKVSKRPNAGKRSSSFQKKQKNGASSPQKCNSKSSGAFPCPLTTYGCQSTFGSKNEWKRHVNTQHMHLGFWRCDQCPQGDRKPNDFNRKDLFIQHVRRMHPVQVETKSTKSKAASAKGGKNDAEEQALTETAKQCYRKVRSPPQRSGCLFCNASFEGTNTWEERMEHVGRHMEAARKDAEDPVDPADWRVDEATEEWLSTEGLIVRSRGQLLLADLKK